MDIRQFFVSNKAGKKILDSGAASSASVGTASISSCNENNQNREAVKNKSTANVKASAGGGKAKLSTIGKWKTEFPWIIVINKEDGGTSIACATCRKFSENSPGPSSTLFIDGCDSLKHDTLLKHAKSKLHITGTKNLNAKADFSSSEMGKILSKIPEKHLKKMKILFNTAYTIAINNLAFSLFPKLCYLQIKNGLDVGSVYLSDKSCFQFVNCISMDLKKKFQGTLNTCEFISILSDSSTDRSTSECEIIYITYCMPNGQHFTNFLSLVELKDGKAETIYQSICEEVSQILPAWKQKLVGICLDGASVNLGIYNGVATRMKSQSPEIISVHCVAHRLELIVADSLKGILLAKNCEDLLKFIYKLYNNSPKLLNELRDMAKLLNEDLLRNTAVLSTRWISSKHKALNALLKNYASLVLSFENLCSSVSLDTIKTAKIKAHLKQLKSYRMMKFICFMTDLTLILGNLSKKFQKDNIGIEDCKIEIETAKNLIKSLRDSGGKEEKNFEANLTETFEYKTVKIVKSDTGDDITDVRTKICNQILTNMLARYKDFIEKKLFKNLYIFDPITLPNEDSELVNFGERELLEIIEELPKNVKESLETSEVTAEYMHWKMWARNKKGLIGEVWDRYIMECSADSQSRNIIRIVLFYRALPASTAICERGFSLLNNIKTEKRNKLNTQTTDMLLRIKLHGPSANEFDPNAAIEMWWNSSIRRTKKLGAEVDKDRKS